MTGIIPPHITDEIIKNGSAVQKAKALRWKVLSRNFRVLRRVLWPEKVGTGRGDRFVYDAKTGSQLPGVLVRSENEPGIDDVGANEAFDGSGTTRGLYQKTYSRNSIDAAGLDLVSTVHYQKGYDNAFWDGQQMVYGDGDEDLPIIERIFNRFTIAIDVIGHELTHGVTQYEANLIYADQSGALNESLSDVFGSLVKQYSLGQTADQADWIIGQGLFTENVNGVGIRSMKAPGTAYDDPVIGKDPQPAHMKDYVNTSADNGGVHINSGIPNRAFYVAAIEIGGNAWEKAGMIWYLALRDKLTTLSNFQDVANKTFDVAGELYGVDGIEQLAVKAGWTAVGIEIGTMPVPVPKGCLPKFIQSFLRKN